ncbi:MAG TPA: hypothetical protein PLW95_03645 [bacterium]|nr:hypothetical protein [bacterium]
MRKKGIALIVVLVIVVLFSAFILIVVLSATSAIRRAHYFDDKTTALTIAEAGLQQVIYNMNYTNYDSGYYPFGVNSDNPLTPSWDETSETHIDTSNFGPQSSCSVRICDGTGEDTRIVSTGKYRGKQARISVEIRSANPIIRGDKLNDGVGTETQGIPEAFNKHTIYANTIGPLSVPNSVTIRGNICAAFWPSSCDAIGEYTLTDTNVSIDTIPRLASDPSVTFPPSPADDNYADKYDASGNRVEGVPTGDVSTIINDGVWWDGVDTYYFGTDDGTGTDTNHYVFTPHSVKIEGANAVLTNGVKIGNYFKCDGEVRVETAVFSGDNAVVDAETITIPTGAEIGEIGPTYCLIVKPSTSSSLSIGNNVTINGDFGISPITTPINLSAGSNFRINGCLFTNESLNINSPITINASPSTKKAGILLYSNVDKTFDLTIANSIGITTGENQVAGIMVYFEKPLGDDYSGKISNITISGNITLNDTENDKFLLINQSDSGYINISSDINGSIYSAYYGGSTSSITLTNGKIYGSIITNGTVNLNGGSIIYNSEAYKKGKGDVYKGFVGGRRVYVPVPGSWRVEW